MLEFLRETILLYGIPSLQKDIFMTHLVSSSSAMKLQTVKYCTHFLVERSAFIKLWAIFLKLWVI